MLRESWLDDLRISTTSTLVINVMNSNHKPRLQRRSAENYAKKEKAERDKRELRRRNCIVPRRSNEPHCGNHSARIGQEIEPRDVLDARSHGGGQFSKDGVVFDLYFISSLEVDGPAPASDVKS